jgi:hypothetical protein
MKIIFLDIDGVLCTAKSHYAFGGKGMMLDWCPTSAALVLRLLEKTGAKLVISSTWRMDPHHEDLNPRLMRFGLWKHLFVNPREGEDWRTDQIGPRGVEVAEWLARHLDVTHWVSLDDSMDFSADQKMNWVLTDPMNGISAENYLQANEILGGEREGMVLL